MIVYHGTTEIIEKPDVVHSKKYLDFGRGFYLTTFENQARKWAVRKGMRQEKPAIVNVYKMNNQICIVNQETLEQVVSFQKAYEVK
jgi:hypothetical protein